MRNMDEEYDAIIEATAISYEKLMELNPEHSLLKLLNGFSHGKFGINQEFSIKYAPRWWELTEGMPREIRAWERYQRDLEDSIKEEESMRVIVRYE